MKEVLVSLGVAKLKCISKEQHCTYEKQSRSEYLREWRKKNPEKVKLHRRKADSNYYSKNRQKYCDREKINYHEYALYHYTPVSHICYECDVHFPEADHKCFVERFEDWKNFHRFPINIWTASCTHGTLSEKQIARNIELVKTLQKYGFIPEFEIKEPEYYMRVVYCWKKNRECFDSIWYIDYELEKLVLREGVNEKEEWDKFNKYMENLFSKGKHDSYEKHEGFEEYKKLIEEK